MSHLPSASLVNREDGDERYRRNSLYFDSLFQGTQAEEIVHGGIDAEVVGHRGQNNVAVLKRLGDQLGDMGGGHVVQCHTAHALVAERRRQRLRRVLRVAVQMCIRDRFETYLGYSAAAFLRSFPRSQRQRLPPPLTCLLYTSKAEHMINLGIHQ